MLDIFIDTSSRTFVSDLGGGLVTQPSSLPFFYPDTLQLAVHLLTPIGNAPLGTPQYAVMPTTGLTLLLYIDGGSEGSPIMTQVVNWQTDAENSYFYGNLALNTLPIKQLLGPKINVSAYLKIGYIQQGNSRTLITAPITIQAGMPANALVVPPGLTPLSLQAATQLFVPFLGIAGKGFYLITPTGKKIYYEAVDNPDGTASPLASPVN